jgi:hypothetical protein
MLNYQEKYLKYKRKYINEKNNIIIRGGGDSIFEKISYSKILIEEDRISPEIIELLRNNFNKLKILALTLPTPVTITWQYLSL